MFLCLKPGRIYFPYNFLTKPCSALDFIISSYNNTKSFQLEDIPLAVQPTSCFAFRAAAAHGV